MNDFSEDMFALGCMQFEREVLIRGNTAKVGGGEVSCHFGKFSGRVKCHG